MSFRREKFVPRGGPDGGDGGDGGDVVLVVDPHLRTLLHLRHQTLFQAERGMNGQGKQMFGRDGGDCLIRVPVGTTVRNAATHAWLADLVTPGASLVVARGGRGGKGNVHFKSSTRRAPRIATPGGDGEQLELELELRLLADVGLVGLPNVGKSTLLARVSNARPKIGDFPFTTLEPNLGIVRVGEYFTFVMADIPGLVEGAHQGRGLGTRFLRHIERTRVLLFLLDSLSPDPARDLAVLHSELVSFSPNLASRPAIVAFSRADLRGPAWSPPEVGGLRGRAFSSQSGVGVEDLLWALRQLLEDAPGTGPVLEDDAGAEGEPEGPGAAAREVSVVPDALPLPFAARIDAGASLGDRPWPRAWFVGKSARDEREEEIPAS